MFEKWMPGDLNQNMLDTKKFVARKWIDTLRGGRRKSKRGKYKENKKRWNEEEGTGYWTKR